MAQPGLRGRGTCGKRRRAGLTSPVNKEGSSNGAGGGGGECGALLSYADPLKKGIQTKTEFWWFPSIVCGLSSIFYTHPHTHQRIRLWMWHLGYSL